MFCPPQFWGVRATAANVSGGKGKYTVGEFREDFPQFFGPDGEFLVPEEMLTTFVAVANDGVTPDKWGKRARYAAGLYVAHMATVYLSAYAESNATPQDAAARGALVGVARSVTMGDVSVAYDTSAVSAATSEWGNLNATKYGQTLASMARLVGMAGSYAI